MERHAEAAAVTLLAIGTISGARRRFGPGSRSFAFVSVWVPMAALGTMSRWYPPRLPERWHRLRPFEADGHLYEVLGVRAAKAALRRGPFAAFNPHLHLPVVPTPGRVSALDERMRTAEASHTLLFLATLGAAAQAAARGRWTAARWMLGWNLVMNGYPAMLQRYNRALLQKRFGPRPS